MSKRPRREIKSVHIFEGTDDSALLDACYILITARRARLAAKTEDAPATIQHPRQDSPAPVAK